MRFGRPEQLSSAEARPAGPALRHGCPLDKGEEGDAHRSGAGQGTVRGSDDAWADASAFLRSLQDQREPQHEGSRFCPDWWA